MTETKPNWYPMWKELGIDIEKHDILLSVLPKIYKEVYIDAQENRPENMSFWDFVVGDIHGIRPSEIIKAKENNIPVIGTFCLYVPDEIILALDGISIGLCGGTNFSDYAAEDKLPANICPLIKSALGFGLGNICPYYASADLLIGETTCDGKKKAWEILAPEKEIYVLETPQCKTREQAKEHFHKEIKSLINFLEKKFDRKLSFDKLKAAMEKIQKKRNLLEKIYNARKVDPVPISGKDALLISQVAFYDDPDRQIQMLEKLNSELQERIENKIGATKKGAKRIMISGTPQAIPNWKLHHLIENAGATVIVEETCTGTRYFESKLDLSGKTVDDLLDAIVDRYMGINCACFTPNNNRYEDILRLAKEYNVDGIILYSLSFCTPYEVEAISLAKKLKKTGIKVLNITTDYSSEDEGQLENRIDAFLEII